MTRDVTLARIARLRGQTVAARQRDLAVSAAAAGRADAAVARATAALTAEAARPGETAAFARWLPVGLAQADQATRDAIDTSRALAHDRAALASARAAEAAIAELLADRLAKRRRASLARDQTAIEDLVARPH